MLQGVLTERFKLPVHQETREQPVYLLVVARRDRSPGPRLKALTVDCATTADVAAVTPPSSDSPCGGMFGVGPAGGTIVSKASRSRASSAH